MPRILFTWELGGGLGHLMEMKPLARGLLERGHKIFAALKDLSRARPVLGPGIVLLQAPMKTRPPDQNIRTPPTFAHILHNIGYEHAHELGTLVGAWRGLFALTRPDLIVFDHSPTALLAARGLPVRKILIGSGFSIPLDQHPLPNLRPELKLNPSRLIEDQQRVLGKINRVLAEFRQPPLERITQLYAEVDDTFLITLPELDHYPNRKVGRYFGPCYERSGTKPQWPEGAGRRIFAYLKTFSALTRLLEELVRRQHPTIILSDGIGPSIQKRFSRRTLRFQTDPLDISAVAAECDLAILNAGHGTTADMLLAGRPVYLFPIYLEQGMFAPRVVRELGAGLAGSHTDGSRIPAQLDQLLSSDHYAAAAQRFAATHADLDFAQTRREMVYRADELLSPPVSEGQRIAVCA